MDGMNAVVYRWLDFTAYLTSSDANILQVWPVLLKYVDLTWPRTVFSIMGKLSIAVVMHG